VACKRIPRRSSCASSDATHEILSSSLIEVLSVGSETARRTLDFLEGFERFSSRRFLRYSFKTPDNGY
jgi:hypothetical protein